MIETDQTMFNMTEALCAIIERVAPAIETFNRVLSGIGSMIWND